MNAKQRDAVMKRLRKARAGSRELDADVMEALGYRVVREAVNHRGIAWRYQRRPHRRGINHRGYWEALPMLTRSLDAAIDQARAERTAADDEILISIHAGGRAGAAIGHPDDGLVISDSLANPALAVCHALLARLDTLEGEGT